MTARHDKATPDDLVDVETLADNLHPLVDPSTGYLHATGRESADAVLAEVAEKLRQADATDSDIFGSELDQAHAAGFLQGLADAAGLSRLEYIERRRKVCL